MTERPASVRAEVAVPTVLRYRRKPLHIKVCCIANLDEARAAIDAGAAALGFVSAMPSGPGVIDEATIAAIAAAVPREVETFLLTAHTDATAIVAQHRRGRTTTLQLVDALLLDSGNPQLAVKQLGGTGRTHDWAVSREIVRRAGVPVWLAGGLDSGTAWPCTTS